VESQPMKMQRRNFLKTGSFAIASLAFASRAVAQQKPAQLDEKDAQAQALGYRNDAAQVDKKKFANWQTGQTCANCAQYQGKPSDASGPCAIFPGKQVSAKGWCSVWQKKA
jgi:hypothetical protein